MTYYKHQSYCDPCYYPKSCYGGYGSRVRRYSSGSCYGGSQGIRYVPTCIPSCDYGYGGYGYGNQGTSICYQPYGYNYGSSCYRPRGCYPYNYGQGYQGGYKSYGCYPYNYGQGYQGSYKGYGCYPYNYGQGYYGQGYGGYSGYGGYGRRYSCSSPCYGYRRHSISGPCA